MAVPNPSIELWTVMTVKSVAFFWQPWLGIPNIVALKGDLLKVEFLNLSALDGDEWGFIGTFDKENGGGFLTDHYPRATKVWTVPNTSCFYFTLHLIHTGYLEYWRRILLQLSHPWSTLCWIDPSWLDRHSSKCGFTKNLEWERSCIGCKRGDREGNYIVQAFAYTPACMSSQSWRSHAG